MVEGENKRDILLRSGNIINVFTLTVEERDIHISDGKIKRLYSRQEEIEVKEVEVIDIEGHYVAPGLIDGHIHLESTMVTPQALAEEMVPRGTTALIADPHEIANVLGLPGIVGLAEMTKSLPLDIFFMIPSSVPATPLETAGAQLDAKEIGWLLDHLPQAIGLAEVMNYPAVIAGEEAMLAKIEEARKRKKPVDGHAPGLVGSSLQEYIAAGISSDHECVDVNEGWEKLQRGMHLLIREGSAAKNLAHLAPLLTSKTVERISFCSDDRHPEDLLQEGHLDHLLRQALEEGLDPLLAIKACTWTTARHYGLLNRGAIAPGYQADLVVFNDLKSFSSKMVLHRGEVVAREGILLSSIEKKPSIERSGDPLFTQSVHLPDIQGKLLPQLTPGRDIRVIGIERNQIVTTHERAPSDEIGPEKDLLHLAVIERHGKKGSIGQAIVRGFGIKKGAVASTVAHDSHNLIVLGTNDHDMEKACRAVADLGGGMAVVVEGHVKASVPLPIAGLMSPASVREVAAQLQKLHQVLHTLGCSLEAPMMTLSFLALPVIPELKVTDQGLVDVKTFQTVPLEL
ncbi:adenine deaminase [Heliorestis convoluta]|uniref:Adenine deaminase n=1 Tax=Heliorestis convoluta TaxID=356322 RepID=A0A5Q2N931_9FIRM|nr:adenine deaminase [Heliorestis convoluta]QGG49005.1 adenine deaminase [Heliorestis convoluta]